MFLALELPEQKVIVGEVVMALVKPDGARDYAKTFILREAGTRHMFRCIAPHPDKQCRELTQSAAIDRLNHA